MMRILLVWAISLSSAYAGSPEYTGMIQQGDWLRMVFGLLLVLFLIILLALAVRKLQGMSFHSSQGMNIISQMALGPKERVMLIYVGGRYLLIGVTNHSIQLLQDFGLQLPSGFDSSEKKGFADILKSMKGKS